MKKLFVILGLFLIVTLVSCSKPKTTNNPNETAVTLNTEQSMALSAYLASGMLNTDSLQNMSLNSGEYTLRLLADNNGFTIDTDLDVVNQYFDMLKAFMDNGVSSQLTINEATSDKEGYDNMVTYTIEGVTYTIYYSVVVTDNPAADTTTTEPETTVPADTTTTQPETTEPENEEVDLNEHQEFELTGLIVIDGVEYQLEGKSVVENNETKMFFEAVDPDNSGNTVRVELKNEEEQQQFKLISDINGVEKSSWVKFTQENNLTKVELRLSDGGQDSTYRFMKVVEDGKTMYKLDYQIGTTKGQVKIQEITDENGVVTYRYKITENGKTKNVDKEKQHGKKHNQHENTETTV